MITLSWISFDGQVTLAMGTFASRAEAEAALDNARAELIAVNNEAEDSAEIIDAGSWSIEAA